MKHRLVRRFPREASAIVNEDGLRCGHCVGIELRFKRFTERDENGSIFLDARIFAAGARTFDTMVRVVSALCQQYETAGAVGP